MSARFLTARRRRDPQLVRPAAGLLAAAGRPRAKAPLGLVDGGDPPAPIPFPAPQARRESVPFRLSPAEEDQLRSLLAALGTRSQATAGQGRGRWGRQALLLGAVLIVGVLVPQFRSSPASKSQPVAAITVAMPAPRASPDLIAAREGEGVFLVAAAPAVLPDRVEAPVLPAPAPILADPPLSGPATPALLPVSPELVAAREGEGERTHHGEGEPEAGDD